MTWTDARIAELARLWAAGVSASGIAEALGEVSRSAVLGKLHRLRLLRSRHAASAPRRYEGEVNGVPSPRPPPIVRPAAPRAPPEPPRSPWRDEVFAPLPGSRPTPWLSRGRGECAFPVSGDADKLLSCCAPTTAKSAYCAAHHRVVFRPLSLTARAAEQRRWSKAAEAWSEPAAPEIDNERSAA